jgi:hypothetical protein
LPQGLRKNEPPRGFSAGSLAPSIHSNARECRLPSPDYPLGLSRGAYARGESDLRQLRSVRSGVGASSMQLRCAVPMFCGTHRRQYLPRLPCARRKCPIDLSACSIARRNSSTLRLTFPQPMQVNCISRRSHAIVFRFLCPQCGQRIIISLTSKDRHDDSLPNREGNSSRTRRVSRVAPCRSGGAGESWRSD